MTDLDAVRELDAIVATRIFGYTLDYEFVDTLGAPCVNELRDEHDEWGMLPHYSTDIGDAWLVVEHHPHFVSLTRSNDNGRFGFKDHMTWRCRFYAPQSFEVEADTAPLAICRAALACVVSSNDRAPTV